MKSSFANKALNLIQGIDGAIHAALARAAAPHVIPEFAMPVSARAVPGGSLGARPMRFAGDQPRPASVAFWPERSV